MALDLFLDLRKLIPHGELAGELRAIARDDERAARDQRRLLNRLRSDLLATFPAALHIAGDDLGSVTMLKLLATWPTHAALAELDRDALQGFARSVRNSWPDRFADRVAAALATGLAQLAAPHHPGQLKTAATAYRKAIDTLTATTMFAA